MVTRGHTVMRQFVGHVGANPITVGMSWSDTDPIAVTVVFTNGEPGAEPVRWLIGRDLLEAGLSDWPVGDGDVRVWTGAGPTYHLRVTGQGISVVVKVDADDVFSFLAATDEVCPSGSIDEQMRVERSRDAYLTALVGGAA